jgi:hypothetical protein
MPSVTQQNNLHATPVFGSYQFCLLYLANSIGNPFIDEKNQVQQNFVIIDPGLKNAFENFVHCAEYIFLILLNLNFFPK